MDNAGSDSSKIKPTGAPRNRATKPTQSKSGRIFLAAAGVVVLLGGIAFVTNRSSSTNIPVASETVVSPDLKISSEPTVVPITGNLSENQSVTVTGPALAGYTGAGVDPAIGKVAPRLDGKTFNGRIVNVVPIDGPSLVMFVAHWCPHCRKEVPLVVGWLGGKAPDGVTFRAVSTSTNPNYPNYPPSKWLNTEKWIVPTIADDANGSAAKAFGLQSFPYFVAIGKDGKVVRRASGEVTEQDFNDMLNAARNG